MSDRPLRLAIAIPTYNEAESLPALLDALGQELGAIAELIVEVLVIDDNSPDGTGKLAEQLSDELNTPAFGIRVLHRERKDGLGKAYVEGLQLLVAGGEFDCILQMDADLSHQPSHIPQLLEAYQHADFVVGSRYIAGGGTPDWGWHRRLLSRAGNIYTRLILGSRITDYTGGFTLFSVRLLKHIDLARLTASGYGFNIELKYRSLQASREVRQVPIVFLDRRVGSSKIPKNTLVKNLILVPRLRFSEGASSPLPR